MIDPHVAELSRAIEALARDAQSGGELALLIRRSYPSEPTAILRRAIYYALSDPDRRDDALTLRLFDAAFAILSGADLYAVQHG